MIQANEPLRPVTRVGENDTLLELIRGIAGRLDDLDEKLDHLQSDHDEVRRLVKSNWRKVKAAGVIIKRVL